MNGSTGAQGLPEEPALVLRGVSAGYGLHPVVQELSLSVRQGELLALLGANGAGKTTTLLAISGLLPVTTGEVRVLGTPVRYRHGHLLASVGLAHVPDNRGVFHGLTVRENLLVDRRVRRTDVDTALALFPALGKLINRQVAYLSGGEQQMLAVARALAVRPKVLLLDQLSHGLAPLIVEEIMPTIKRACLELPCAVVLVEQHVRIALEFADRGCVLARGRMVMEGSAADVAEAASSLEAAYLGEAPQ